MKKNIPILLILLLLAGCYASTGTGKSAPAAMVSPVSAAPSGRVLQYGIYTRVRGGEVVDSARTTTGKALSNLVMTRDRTTDRIPLVKDKLMAYQYRLSNLPDTRMVRLRRVLKHPPFTLPDGTVSDGSDYMIRRMVERGEVFAFDAYGLNEGYEMVEGDWFFQIWYGEQLLVEQKFTTYWPEDNAPAGLDALTPGVADG